MKKGIIIMLAILLTASANAVMDPAMVALGTSTYIANQTNATITLPNGTAETLSAQNWTRYTPQIEGVYIITDWSNENASNESFIALNATTHSVFINTTSVVTTIQSISGREVASYNGTNITMLGANIQYNITIIAGDIEVNIQNVNLTNQTITLYSEQNSAFLKNYKVDSAQATLKIYTGTLEPTAFYTCTEGCESWTKISEQSAQYYQAAAQGVAVGLFATQTEQETPRKKGSSPSRNTFEMESRVLCDTRLVTIYLRDSFSQDLVFDAQYHVKQADLNIDSGIASAGLISLVLPDGTYTISANKAGYLYKTGEFEVKCKKDLIAEEWAVESLEPKTEQPPKEEIVTEKEPKTAEPTANVIAEPEQAWSTIPLFAIIISGALIFASGYVTINAKRPKQKRSAEAQMLPAEPTVKIVEHASAEQVHKQDLENLRAIAYPDHPLHKSVPEQEHFVLSDGRKISSVAQLRQFLEDMHPETFASHVTAHRNDFAAWIHHSVKDEMLASQIGPVKYKDQMKDLIHERIELLNTILEMKK